MVDAFLVKVRLLQGQATCLIISCLSAAGLHPAKDERVKKEGRKALQRKHSLIRREINLLCYHPRWNLESEEPSSFTESGFIRGTNVTKRRKAFYRSAPVSLVRQQVDQVRKKKKKGQGKQKVRKRRGSVIESGQNLVSARCFSWEVYFQSIPSR